MIVSLFTKEKLYTISLPKKASGKYWISDKHGGHQRHVADVEGVQNQWVIHGSSVVSLQGHDGAECDSIPLGDGIHVISGQYRKSREKAQFYIEPATGDRQEFQKYQVTRPCKLNIGRADDNQIAYANNYVSAHHACLSWQDGRWSVTDTNSSNGTFVNENRVKTQDLLPGDTVYVMGLKIIVGSGFFAMNNPDGQVHISAAGVNLLQPQKAEDRDMEFAEPVEESQFSPSPTLHRKIERAEIRVDAPPAPQLPDETPIGLLLGPALTMGMTAVVMATVAISNYLSGTAKLVATIPTLVMSFSMLCGTLLWPTLTRRHEKKKRLRIEALRNRKYSEYLAKVRGDIFSIGAEQKEILLENFPDNAECARRAAGHEQGLWERSAEKDGFLTLRLGLGTIPIDAQLRFPEWKFSLDEDSLQNEVQRLANEPKVIANAPVTCSLKEHPILGIVGKPEETEAFFRGLLIQLVTLHSYDDVKLVFLAGETYGEKWKTFRAWPHCWDDGRQFRYWACDEDDGKALSSQLEKIFMDSEEEGSKQPTGPRYVLVVPSMEYADQIGVFKQFVSEHKKWNMSCIIQASDITLLPKECSSVIQLQGERSLLYNRDDPTDFSVEFKAEDAAGVDLESATCELANLLLDNQSAKFVLPNMLTFLELYGVGKVEHLNALTRWRDNNPVNTLQAPVGVAVDGSTFYLDLHEKFHGPHGLVAGMTGSGKSEFIITFILSMAVNYHPDEVSFILIDYKGGGLAGAFEDQLTGMRLPHLAGTITNLDGSAVNRALISIQSELRRRQAVFNQARQISGEGTIDIYKYQKMYRNGQLKTPVPHLFIISDEFAELKAQQPEFMAQLISTARIGRSLGVHLILATQKPSGVVDDQIWSNSRFRVCLKVQEKADSTEMLKRPDAAELSDTGRFYLQVGFNELFELGQSAWCGAPYLPADRVAKKRDTSVEVVDHLGRVLSEAKPKTTGTKGDGKSQIVSIVSYLSNLAKDEGLAAQQLWLPPIPEFIYLDDLRAKYGKTDDPLVLNPILGEYDDPFNQSQGLVTLPLTEAGNALLYGLTGSGKNTLLSSMVCDLLHGYTADQLNLYIIDLGEETLRAFDQAPQVGDVLLGSDEEKIRNLFKMLEEEMWSRKKLFTEYGGDYRSYCKATGNTVPHIMVILRNYSAFYEQFEELDDQLMQISRECFKYGIYFLLTANSANAIRYRIAQNFPTVICLQLTDRSDYISLFGNTEGVYPSKIKGRGIFATDRVYEFQAAHFAEDDSPQAIRELSARLAQEAGGHRARRVPNLPKRVISSYFDDPIQPAAFPVGVDKESLQPVTLDLEQAVCTPVSAQDASDLVPVAQGLAEHLTRLDGSVTVWDGGNLFSDPGSGVYSYISGSFADTVDALFNEMVTRNNTYKAAKKDGAALPRFSSMYYVITGYNAIMEDLDAEHKDRLATLLNRAEQAYRVRFLFCDENRDMKAYSSEPWAKKNMSPNGLWVGNGISDQYVLRIARMVNSLYADVPAQFGYLVQRGKPVLAKLLVSEQTEEVEEL